MPYVLCTEAYVMLVQILFLLSLLLCGKIYLENIKNNIGVCHPALLSIVLGKGRYQAYHTVQDKPPIHMNYYERYLFDLQ